MEEWLEALFIYMYICRPDSVFAHIQLYMYNVMVI